MKSNIDCDHDVYVKSILSSNSYWKEEFIRLIEVNGYCAVCKANIRCTYSFTPPFNKYKHLQTFLFAIPQHIGKLSAENMMRLDEEIFGLHNNVSNKILREPKIY